MEKKVYETPEVTKVEYDASDRITASGCGIPGATSTGMTLADRGISACLY